MTISENMTITHLSDGYHNMTIYALDDAGNVGDSKNVNFNIKLPYEPPPKSDPQEVQKTIAYFESENLTIKVLDSSRPVSYINQGTVQLESKEALADFAHNQGVTTIKEVYDNNVAMFGVYIYPNHSPLPIIYFIWI